MTPLLAERRAAAATLGAATLVLLLIPPLAANGGQILFWSDLLLVAFAFLVAWWVRRQRRLLPVASPPPEGSTLLDDPAVLRSQAAWGAPFLLFALIVAAALPEFFGYGLAVGVLAGTLALEAKHLARWESRTGVRVYRERKRGWRKRDSFYRLER